VNHDCHSKAGDGYASQISRVVSDQSKPIGEMSRIMERAIVEFPVDSAGRNGVGDCCPFPVPRPEINAR
jgi:hypothetical protein